MSNLKFQIQRRRNMKRANIVDVDVDVGIPGEIIEEILSRLPVRSLLRLRCVSKSWRSLIDSKRFIQTHLIQNSTKNAHHRVIVDFIGPCYSKLKQLKQWSWYSMLNEPVIDSFAFDNHVNIHWNSTSDDRVSLINLVGCCNGLVCIHLDRKVIILWNPSTRMSKKLPFPCIGYQMNRFTKYGLGYDECSDDYKVVMLGIADFSNLVSIRWNISSVYSLKTNSWKPLEDEDEDVPLYRFHGEGKCASGNLHWSWSRPVGLDMEIVSFDLKSEVYRVIEQPSYSRGTFRPILGVMGGCLSVLCDSLDSGHLDVWVMKEYGVRESWAKLVALSNVPSPPIGERGVIRLFCTLPNGEILLLYKSTFMIYYPKDNVFRHCNSIDVQLVTQADVCIESLVSLASDTEPVV